MKAKFKLSMSFKQMESRKSLSTFHLQKDVFFRTEWIITKSVTWLAASLYSVL